MFGRINVFEVKKFEAFNKNICDDCDNFIYRRILFTSYWQRRLRNKAIASSNFVYDMCIY